ncbi:transporter substrate-binding domain-containing protein [Arcobacter peruensis]|uniref:transporter substrate-binding domain-containing protein n=1 Tax=Arcobacter peruensis TaxID=2320140 RepID=UPI000F07DB8F|nr:transporter substrate-binding domain-containing protein [Arcobacter peruensis]
MKYLLILFIFLFSALANNNKEINLNLTDKELEYLENKPIIKIAYADVFEPYIIKSSTGNIRGIIPDVYNLLSQKFNLKFEYHIDDWQTTLKNLKDGKVDVIPYMNYTIAKKRGFLTATTFANGSLSIYAKDDENDKINSISDLKGKKVGFNTNIIFLHKALAKYKDIIDFTPTKTSIDSFYKLDNGSLDAVISFSSDKYLLADYALTNIKTAYNITEFSLDTTTAIKPNDKLLQSIIDKAISTLNANEKAKIFSKYLGNDDKVSSLNLSGEEKKYLDSKAFLRTQFEDKYFPYLFKENNLNRGFLVDLIKIISEKIDKKIEYIPIENKKEAKDMLLKNKLDFVSHYIKTPQRDTELLFTEESILDTNIGLVSLKNKNYTFNDIENKTVSVVKGYHIEKVLRKYYPNTKIKLLDNNFDLIQSVIDETSDFAISNQAVLKYIININELEKKVNNVTLNNKHFFTRLTYIVFNNSNEILKSIFDKAFSSISAQEMNILYDKWFIKTPKKSFLSQEEQNWLKNNKSIRMCANPIWEPIGFYNETAKQYEGISIDTMNLIKEKLNNKIEFEYIPTTTWKQTQEFLKDKKCDIIPILVKNEERSKYALFTKPYLNYRYAILTKDDKPFAKGLEDIVDKSIARKEGSATITQILKQYPNTKIIETEDFLDSLRKVSKEEAYAALAILPTLSYNASHFNTKHIQIAGYANMEMNLSIASRKDKIILHNILEKALSKITKKEHKDIQNKWMGIEIKEVKTNNTFYIIISIILLLLAFYYFYKDFKSKKELKKINIKLLKFNENLEEKVSEQTKDLKNLNLKLSISNEQLQTTNQELQNSNEELLITEEDLRIRQVELINQHEKILELSKIKAQFLANMSHEIRTPLNGIVGVTRLMLDEGDDLKQKHKEQLKIIQKSSEILTNIVNDILDYSALSTGNIKLFEEEFSLRSMIAHIKSITEINIKEKGLKYIIDIDEEIQENVIGDEFRISQILMNIISNATKFTNKGYIKLKIRKKIKKNGDNVLKFTIVDTGIGMNKEVQKSLFNSFNQSDQSNTREHKGTGLGLSIVYQLVKLMEGKISTQSTQGQGSTFFVELSLKSTGIENDVKEIPTSTYYSLTKSKKALFVEDDEINQIVISETLKKIGFNTDYAINGKQAVDKVMENEYDIIFMDIQMPIMDGYEATKIIRQSNKNIPIIALSAGVMPKDIDKSLKAGMNMHIAKPIVYNEMNEVLDKYFKVEIKE